MELHSFISSLSTALAFILFLCCLVIQKRKINNTKQKPPQPSGSWPIIGHLPLLRKGLPHITMGNLADKYGPIFMIKLGVHQAIVVSSSATAKECLSTNDRVFATRPSSVFQEHLSYNSLLVGFSPYGPYWREMRKIFVSELLSNHRIEKLKHVRALHLRSVIKDLYSTIPNKRKLSSCYDKKSLTVDMKQWFNDININISVKFIAGKTLHEIYPGEDEYKKCLKSLRDFFDLGGVFTPSDALPFLRWLDIGRYEKAMKKVAKEIDHLVQSWLDEHKASRISEDQGKEKQDIIGVLFGIIEARKNDPVLHETDAIVKATSMAFLLAGTDTTSVTLTWALSLLINNRECLKKVQAEIDHHVGKERKLEESDLRKLVYLEAVIKETMRLYPAGPLIQREAMTDCTVSGYQIDAGTQLYINASKIQRDPKLWTDPLKFDPERFLTTHTECDVRGHNFELIPFGSGRRSCPAVSISLLSMQFTLANLFHAFNFSTVLGEAVDMTEGFGLTNLKATPLEVILKPRLPEYVYNL